MLKQILLILSLSLSGQALAHEETFPLQKAPVDVGDLPSLQRGARLFADTCSGCHSLEYMRYNTLAEGIGLKDSKGRLMTDLVKTTLAYAADKITDPIKTAMSRQDAQNWFGTPPPDLTLVARIRGADWLYTYLQSFYQDETKLWGANNAVFPDVAMPPVFANLQGVQVLEPAPQGEANQPGVLKLLKPGELSPTEFKKAIADLVNFLVYVSEPVQLERKRIGVWVLLALCVFVVFAYLLKREYWKDVH